MKAKQIFLLIIPFYVMMVGFLYPATIILGLPLFYTIPPESYYLMGVSVFFSQMWVFLHVHQNFIENDIPKV
jgi:hypothetical protein